MYLLCIPYNIYGQDTLSLVKKLPQPSASKSITNTVMVKPRFKPDPLKATMLAVTFPGLGQIYNRKYWKVPLVYAGFGGLAYSISFNSSKYNKYVKAYQDFTDKIKETNSYIELIPDNPTTYDPVLYPESYKSSNEAHWKDIMLQGIDYYRRYRDLSYLGIAGWYLVSIIDANVDASLFDFDISDNLDIVLFPTQVELPGGYMGAAVNVSVTINF
jgi:hypothetical protein